MADKDVERARKESESWHNRQIGNLLEEEWEYAKQMATQKGSEALWYLTQSYETIEGEIAEHKRDIRELRLFE